MKESNDTNNTQHISENGLGELEFHLRLNNDPIYKDSIEKDIDSYIDTVSI